MLPEAHGRSSKQREPPETCREEQQRTDREEKRSVLVGQHFVLLNARLFSLRLPLLYSVKKGAVSLIYFLPTESNYPDMPSYLILYYIH